MKLNGTLFISQVLHEQNTLIQEASKIGDLESDLTIAEVLEYSEIIREITAEMDAENDLVVDYNSLYRRLSKREMKFDVEPETAKLLGKSCAWLYAVCELDAFKKRGGMFTNV